MGRVFSQVNIPTVVAVLLILMADKALGVSDRGLALIGRAPRGG